MTLAGYHRKAGGPPRTLRIDDNGRLHVYTVPEISGTRALAVYRPLSDPHPLQLIPRAVAAVVVGTAITFLKLALITTLVCLAAVAAASV